MEILARHDTRKRGAGHIQCGIRGAIIRSVYDRNTANCHGRRCDGGRDARRLNQRIVPGIRAREREAGDHHGQIFPDISLRKKALPTGRHQPELGGVGGVRALQSRITKRQRPTLLRPYIRAIIRHAAARNAGNSELSRSDRPLACPRYWQNIITSSESGLSAGIKREIIIGKCGVNGFRAGRRAGIRDRGHLPDCYRLPLRNTLDLKIRRGPIIERGRGIIGIGRVADNVNHKPRGINLANIRRNIRREAAITINGQPTPRDRYIIGDNRETRSDIGLTIKPRDRCGITTQQTRNSYVAGREDRCLRTVIGFHNRARQLAKRKCRCLLRIEKPIPRAQRRRTRRRTILVETGRQAVDIITRWAVCINQPGPCQCASACIVDKVRAGLQICMTARTGVDRRVENNIIIGGQRQAARSGPTDCRIDINIPRTALWCPSAVSARRCCGFDDIRAAIQ